MKKTKVTRSLLAACSIVALSAVMYGCVHSGDSDDTPPPVVEPEPTAYEAGLAAIQAADTAAAAQAAYDAVDLTAVTGDEAAKLQTALSTRLDALSTAARVAEQKKNLMTAAGAIDTSDLSTQEAVDAARKAIADLRGALTAAADVSDADKAPYQTALTNAVDAVDEAQGGIDTETRRTNQMAALSGASKTLQAALAALSGATPTQAQLDAANNALTALNGAITAAADLTDEEKATYVREASNAKAPIQTAQDAKGKVDDDKDKTDNAAMAVKASKLYSGISAPTAVDADPESSRRHAAYNDADTAITVTNGATTASLSEDKKTDVAAHIGWEGMKFTASPEGGGTYEATVYSNVGDPTEGRKFASTAAVTDDGDYEYQLTATNNTEVAINTGQTGVAGRVKSPSFDQSAGTKTFERGTNLQRIKLSGSYHGVSGNYYCAPIGSGAAANQCTSTKAAEGFTLGGGTWTFEASNNETRVMSTPDANYASYGWWLHTESDGDFVASAFADTKGTVSAASGIDTLQGTATYKGGAAGQYALRSSTGGTNDAGRFTARATLEADFGDDKITGTIDNFMGDDGESRDWSIELMEQGVGAGGIILGDDGTGTAKQTKWTIGGDSAPAGGQ